MATIGLDKLYYATITDDENGEEIYGTPTQLAKAISAELSVELAEATLYADDGAAEIVKEFKKDRKSTRLNSSHVSISYAVFCLKKKKKTKETKKKKKIKKKTKRKKKMKNRVHRCIGQLGHSAVIGAMKHAKAGHRYRRRIDEA